MNRSKPDDRSGILRGCMAIANQTLDQAVPGQTVRRLSLFPLLAMGSLILTGASGLMYQVVWFRTLGTVFGVTVQATSAVLAAFMAGLAIGSFAVGPITRRLRSPLRAYGIAELTVGVAGIASLAALDLLSPLYQTLARSAPDNLAAVTGLRFALASLILLVPTTLMGATLPLVVSAPEFGLKAHGGVIARLYAANTAGAITGTALAGFILIGTIGLTGTTAVAAAFNIVVGLVWLAIGGQRPEADAAERTNPTDGTDPQDHSHSHTPTPTHSRLVSQRRFVLVTYGVCGALALALEVAWTRVLAGIFPGTVYAFALMLCTILAGIAIGSAVSQPIVKHASLRAYGWLAGGTGLLGVFSLAMLGQTNRIEGAIRSALAAGGEPLTTVPWFMISIGMVALGPAALAMGMLFPVTARLYGDGLADVGQRLGQIYGANTIGAVSGSLLGGLVLIPAFGVQRTIWLLSLGYVAVGLAALLLWREPGVSSVRRSYGLVVSALLVAPVAGAALLIPDLYQSLSAHDPRGEQTLWYQEGQEATVRVVRMTDGALGLRINSEGQGSDSGSGLRFHRRLGHLGMLLHPDPKEVLLIGLGVGATPGAAATHPGSRVTVVELYPEVLHAARLFEHINYDVLDRTNVVHEVNDGRNHLLLHAGRYDVIQADPVLPTNAGAGNLYSADFYRLVRASLRDGGLMVQWVNPGLPKSSYQLLLRSFQEAFPESTLWYAGAAIVGSNGPFRVDVAALDRKFANAETRAALADVELRSAQEVLREFTAGPADIRLYAGEGPVNTDRFPRLEYHWSLPHDSATTIGVRSIGAARFLSAVSLPTDGIVYGQEAVRQHFFDQYGTSLDHLVPTGTASLDQLSAFASRQTYLWFVPFPNQPSPLEVSVEDWLRQNRRVLVDRRFGEVRLLLFAAPGAPPRTIAPELATEQPILLTTR